MTEKMSAHDLDRRVRERGGILEAIEWGIRSDSIEDPELATVWRGIEDQYDDLRQSLIIASRMMVASRRAA